MFKCVSSVQDFFTVGVTSSRVGEGPWDMPGGRGATRTVVVRAGAVEVIAEWQWLLRWSLIMGATQPR